MLATSKIGKIGIGTWGIGGFAEADPHNNDARDIAGLQHWLKKGANYIDVPFFYAGGKTAQLVAQAVAASGVPREALFITLTVYPHRVASAEDMLADFARFCQLFQTNYADSVQVSMGGVLQWGAAQTFGIIDALLQKKQARYVNVTNADKAFLAKLHQRFGPKLFAHEVHFNFEIRANDDLGIIGYATAHHIRNIVAQPLRRNRTATRNWPLLVELGKKYGATQNQVLIAWLVARGMLPIPKATTPAHIDELWAAQELTLEPGDIATLNAWRPPHYTTPKIYWKRPGEDSSGVPIDQLPNVFDEPQQ